MVGHSMGAMFNRGFLARNRGSVAAMIWLDPAHPDQMRNRSLRRRMRSFLFSLESANLFASRNLPRLQIPLFQQLNGLPDAELNAMRTFLRAPSHLRTSAREARSWEVSAKQVRSVRLDAVPLLIISAQKHSLPGWNELQADLTRLSARASHVTFTEASHLSLLARREHASRAAAEIRGFLDHLRV
jgi:pimeloyl-ACP methyl ester carboxylesterase